MFDDRLLSGSDLNGRCSTSRGLQLSSKCLLNLSQPRVPTLKGRSGKKTQSLVSNAAPPPSTAGVPPPARRPQAQRQERQAPSHRVPDEPRRWVADEQRKPSKPQPAPTAAFPQSGVHENASDVAAGSRDWASMWESMQSNETLVRGYPQQQGRRESAPSDARIFIPPMEFLQQRSVTAAAAVVSHPESHQRYPVPGYQQPPQPVAMGHRQAPVAAAAPYHRFNNQGHQAPIAVAAPYQRFNTQGHGGGAGAPPQNAPLVQRQHSRPAGRVPSPHQNPQRARRHGPRPPRMPVGGASSRPFMAYGLNAVPVSPHLARPEDFGAAAARQA